MSSTLSNDSKHDCPCKRIPLCLSSFTAAEYGDVDSLTRHQSSIASREDIAGNTPLHLAAQHGHVAATDMLLRAGCDVNASKGGATPLHRASYSGAVGAMQVLMNCPDCDLLKQDKSFGDEMTPLHKAASGGRYLAVQLLLDNLHSRNLLETALCVKDFFGRTPLQVAIDQNGKAVEESRLVVRWNEIAGGAPNWNACIVLLEQAANGLQLSQKFKTTENPFPSVRLPDCNHCGQKRPCAIASWEASFRKALSSRLDRPNLLQPPNHEISLQAPEDSSPKRFASGKQTSEKLFPFKGQSNISHCGTNCAQCGNKTVVLFIRGSHKVCKSCR